MLKLTGITKDYKVASEYVHALKGVDLEFRKNEFVCILGQSGCGKTTLLNIIGGLDHYTTGDLVIQGKSTKDFSDRDWDVYRNHRIGFIFQSYNLIPHQTVLGNVEIALTIAGISREERKQRATQALERVGLGEQLGKRPNQLSGGQCQRVAIARALVNNPDILLADEPTGALDSETSIQIMELIKEIAAERLVIMVTHNPELAEAYASRIVRFKDGLVESDTNPYVSAEEQPATPEEPAQTVEAPQEEIREEGKKKRRKEKKPRARMNFFSALALSARNLLTKKGRTIITSIAGSIGIISVCLVLALSSGFNHYIKRTEEDMLSHYPVEINETTYDMMSIMMSFTSKKNVPDMEEIGDRVYIDSFLTGLAQGMSVKNDISENYLKYVSEMDPNWYSAIQYGYGASLTDNLFTKVTTGDVEIQGATVPQVTRNLSLSELKRFYIAELERYKPEYSMLVSFARFFGNIVNKMPGTANLENTSFLKYVGSQYDAVAGRLPQSANEAVIVVGASNEVTDLTLAQLGLLNEKEFLTLFDKGKDGKEDEPMYVNFSEIVGKKYVLYYNDEVYSESSDYDPNDYKTYPYEYSGKRADLSVTEKEGIELDVVGVLRLKKGLTYGCLNSGLNITEAIVDQYIAQNMKSEIVSFMKKYSQTFSSEQGTVTAYKFCPSENLLGYYTLVKEERPEDETVSYYRSLEDTALRHVGGSNAPNAVSIYATDFDGKNAMLEYLDAWNDMCDSDGTYNGIQLSEKNKVTYTDTVGLLMNMMQTMLDVITYVLVAFTAISLVVSSVMIGIITYVSVVERVKEIGVLRSLGARKQDIRNLFNAETFIIGLSAGLFGVVVTYLLSIVINAIFFSLTGISGIAALPVLTAFVMVCVSVFLTLISGLIPAQAAAKKDPVIALRTE